MTSYDSRRTLLKNILCDFGGNIKEWERLTMHSVGLSKYENLLNQYGVRDNIWNIVMEYTQIPFPKTQSGILFRNGTYCDTCNTCFGWLIWFELNIRNQYGKVYQYINSIMCDSCVTKNISGIYYTQKDVENMIRLFVRDAAGTYKKDSAASISDILPNPFGEMIKWLGYGDFEKIQVID